MNFSTNTQSSHNSKENLPPSSKTDALPVQRARQRTALGVLSENEQRGRSLNQVSERIYTFKIPLISPHRTLHFNLPHVGTFFSTGKPIFQTKFDLRQLPAHLPGRSIQLQLWRVRRRSLWSCSYRFWSRSGLGQLLPRYWNRCPAEWRPETPAGSEFKWVWQLQKRLPWKTCFLLFAKLRFTPVDPSVLSDESLKSEEALCVSEYAVDIHQHLRGIEVWNLLKKNEH